MPGLEFSGVVESIGGGETGATTTANGLRAGDEVGGWVGASAIQSSLTQPSLDPINRSIDQ